MGGAMNAGNYHGHISPDALSDTAYKLTVWFALAYSVAVGVGVIGWFCEVV
jgi:hypothetical protein